jgi:Ca-activated chloride channel family protein
VFRNSTKEPIMTTFSRRAGLALLAALLLATLSSYAVYRVYARPVHGAATGPRVHATPGAVATAVQVAAQPDPAADVLNAVVGALSPAGKDGVRMTVRADRSALLRDGDGELHVEVALAAPAGDDGARKSGQSNIMVVLDVSGSMAGDKLASAKQALHKLLAGMGPSDRFGLVAYSNEAEVLLPPSAMTPALRAQTGELVDGLGTLGGTNISAGLDLALGQLSHFGRGRNVRVLLLSDGHANAGDSSFEGLQQRARTVTRSDHVLSTLGIGDDFNEDLMASLADAGTGNFFYLSRIDVLDQFVSAELRASERPAAARALALRFEPGPGVTLTDAAGYPLERDGSAVIVRPGNLYPGQRRTLWLTLKSATRGASVAVGDFSLQYKHGRDDVLRELTTGPLPALAVVGDETQLANAIDKDMWRRYVLEAQRHQVGLKLGAAVGNGSAADVDRALHSYQSNRLMAALLGARDVLTSIDELEKEAAASKREQTGSLTERSYNAKQRKARAIYNTRPNASLELNPWDSL